MNSIEILRKLVAFDTTSRNSNLELIAFVQTYLEGLGITCTLVHNADKSKANLFATLPGAGGVTQGGVVLSGHTDVVPVDGQAWDTNPFELTEKGGNLYGRGTCDMKGFIAVCLALVPELQRMPRKKPVHLVWTFDEETSFDGVNALVAYFKANNIRPDGCIVGEPTMMDIVIAHKGVFAWTVAVHGKAAHSSLVPGSCNAIEHAARVIGFIQERSRELRRHGKQDDGFDVPFTTLSTTTVTGGIASNTIPERCTFEYSFRNLPGVTLEELSAPIHHFIDRVVVPEMREEDPAARIEVTLDCNFDAFNGNADADVVKAAQSVLQVTELKKVAYCSEAATYQNYGMNTIVCGPGSIDQAHKANEFVALSELQRAERDLPKIIALLTQ